MRRITVKSPKGSSGSWHLKVCSKYVGIRNTLLEPAQWGEEPRVKRQFLHYGRESKQILSRLVEYPCNGIFDGSRQGNVRVLRDAQMRSGGRDKEHGNQRSIWVEAIVGVSAITDGIVVFVSGDQSILALVQRNVPTNVCQGPTCVQSTQRIATDTECHLGSRMVLTIVFLGNILHQRVNFFCQPRPTGCNSIVGLALVANGRMNHKAMFELLVLVVLSLVVVCLR
mmetsp:Transcript_25489/g.44869  ORF Transcript_25489/g.44869 Transcript_25489/m.44869 type:complete len:226 (-) Transcript_25489:465-1142(-)